MNAPLNMVGLSSLGMLAHTRKAAMKAELTNPIPLPDWAIRHLVRPWVHPVMGIGILLLDLLTGPHLLFPILFVLPVALSAWFCSARMAYTLAVLLPAGRLLIAVFIEQPFPLPHVILNMLIRVGVLWFLAFLVVRNARLTKELQKRVADLVRMCAWTRTVEYEGEWITFEQYLKRRFNLDTTHGISPAAEAKVTAELDRLAPKP
jgi:hypothetical protein